MLSTDRLTLRNWTDEDRIPFSRMNADRRVVGDYPGVMTPSESDALMEQFVALWEEDGISYGVIERRADGRFLGMAGITCCRFEAPIAPCFEIGWALLPEHWGQGYATEAALGWLAHGFGQLDLPEVIGFTDLDNVRSLAVMRRIGMRHDPGRAFDAQTRPESQLLHAISQSEWQRRSRA